MSEFPDGLRYTEEHEYLTATGESGVYRVGITDYAQGELGDVVPVVLVAYLAESIHRPCSTVDVSVFSVGVSSRFLAVAE